MNNIATLLQIGNHDTVIDIPAYAYYLGIVGLAVLFRSCMMVFGWLISLVAAQMARRPSALPTGLLIGLFDIVKRTSS